MKSIKPIKSRTATAMLLALPILACASQPNEAAPAALPSKTCQLKTFNQDSAEVRALCHQAAAQGDAEAQIYLGWMYFLGHGVKQDFPQALKWFGSASEQGEKINMQPQDIFQFMGGLMQFDEEDDAD